GQCRDSTGPIQGQARAGCAPSQSEEGADEGGLFGANFGAKGHALKCYTCMGSNNDDCNRQGSKSCPSYSDACAVVVGHDSGVMKSCSYKSFCSQASSQGYRAPGVRVHCCYSDDCNVKSFASPLPGLSYCAPSCDVRSASPLTGRCESVKALPCRGIGTDLKP
ncbi:hypothetical protein CRENBAI_006018, partial [Crenichthys baileyi]